MSDENRAIHALTCHGALRSNIRRGDTGVQIREHDPDAAYPSMIVMPESHADHDLAVINSAVRRSFDLKHEFSVRWVIVQQKSATLLYLVSHRVLLDGTSMSLLSSELVELCNGVSSTTIDETFNSSQVYLPEVQSGTTTTYISF